MGWQEAAFQVAVTIALVNWIKTLTEDRLGIYSVLVAMGVAFFVVFLAGLPGVIVWYELVKSSVIVGLSAAGLYTVAGKMGNN